MSARGPKRWTIGVGSRILASIDDEWLTATVWIARYPNVDRTAVMRALRRLWDDGLIERRGDWYTYEYRRLQK